MKALKNLNTRKKTENCLYYNEKYINFATEDLINFIYRRYNNGNPIYLQGSLTGIRRVKTGASHLF